MLTLLITSFAILAGYIAFYISKVGLLNSHSHSYLALKHYGLSWLFPVTLFLSAALIIPVALELTPEPFKITAFLTLAPILFTALAPNFYKEGMEKDVHMFSAKLGGALSVVWALLMAVFVSWWLIVPVIGSALLMYTLNRFCKKPVLFLEYAIFLYPYVILLLMIIS